MLEERFFPKVYIIILNYNGWQDTIECLESVLNSDYPNYQIIVVDNGSQNNSIGHIISWFVSKSIKYILFNQDEIKNSKTCEDEKDAVILIQAKENRGYAAGNNIGIKYALAKNDFDYIWILNNDTVIKENSLSKLIDKSKWYKSKNRKVGIIGSKLLYYYKPEVINGIGGRYNKYFALVKTIGILEKDIGQYDDERWVNKIDYIIGASMFVDKDFIKDVGLMCEDYFLYFEELDWILRGKKRGWEIGYCWESIVYHKEGKSTGGNVLEKKSSELSYYYWMRNRILFTKKFYPQYLWLVYIGFLVSIFNKLRKLQFKKLKLICKALLSFL